MIIKEISGLEFDEFANTNQFKSYYQTNQYGELMNTIGYNSLYIGIFENNSIIGASLILVKKIKANIKYGYAPRGFLIDYFDKDKLTEITKSIKSYFLKQGFAFIKINPQIIYSMVNPYTEEKTINEKSIELIDNLVELGYKKLKSNLYFESMLPKYNPILNLKQFDIKNLNKTFKQRITTTNGINLYKGDEYNFNSFYEIIKNKKDNDNKSLDFYKNIYKIFKQTNSIDLWMLEINYHEYLKDIKQQYEKELEINEQLNEEFTRKSYNKLLLNDKMDSDKKLSLLKQEITETNAKIQLGSINKLLATALIVKYDNRINIVISGYTKDHPKLYSNYYLHYKLIEYYKNEKYSFLDLNGITGDFLNPENPYKGLNEFKLNFNPTIYEYIGEFDLMINQTLYSLLWSTKALEKEFDKQ